jgi:hypothetical protein
MIFRSGIILCLINTGTYKCRKAAMVLYCVMQLCMIFCTVYFNILLFVTVEYGFRISPIPCQNILAIIYQSLISFCLVVVFQGKPYVWGVFKPIKDKIKRLAQVEQYCTTHV